MNFDKLVEEGIDAVKEYISTNPDINIKDG